jgi:hypothetical protein
VTDVNPAPAAAVPDGGERLPVGTLREATPWLRRPFTPEAIKFKVQSVFKENTGCVVVAYIDARLVVERLNAVIPDGWSPTYHETSKPDHLECRLTVDGVTRPDVGQSPKGLSKDLYSDALKRAAVHFGVGVSVYALPQITVWMRDAKGRIELRKGTIVLTEEGHRALRDWYGRWLEKVGEPRFGKALDHGDSEGQTIDPDVETGDEFVPEPAPALEDAKAQQLIVQARGLYGEIRKVSGGPQRVPSGKFNGWLTGAAHSHEELEKLVAHLKAELVTLKIVAEASA